MEVCKARSRGGAQARRRQASGERANHKPPPDRLTSKCSDNQMVVLEGFDLNEIKTKAFIEVLQIFEIDSVLIVIPDRDDILERSARNVPRTKVLRSEGLNVYDILKYHHLILLKDAVPKIETALLGQESQSA